MTRKMQTMMACVWMHWACIAGSCGGLLTATDTPASHPSWRLRPSPAVTETMAEEPAAKAAKVGKTILLATEKPFTAAAVNVRNKDGMTPLHLCAKRCHTAVVQLLLDWQADPGCKNEGLMSCPHSP